MRKECKEFGDFLRKVFSYAFVGLDNYKPPVICFIGVKVRNMKKDFNTGGTWRRVGQRTLMIKIYDFFIRLSRYQTIKNNM